MGSKSGNSLNLGRGCMMDHGDPEVETLDTCLSILGTWKIDLPTPINVTVFVALTATFLAVTTVARPIEHFHSE